jgi:hypothetical protein
MLKRAKPETPRDVRTAAQPNGRAERYARKDDQNQE